jgi:hypothetical protein
MKTTDNAFVHGIHIILDKFITYLSLNLHDFVSGLKFIFLKYFKVLSFKHLTKNTSFSHIEDNLLPLILKPYLQQEQNRYLLKFFKLLSKFLIKINNLSAFTLRKNIRMKLAFIDYIIPGRFVVDPRVERLDRPVYNFYFFFSSMLNVFNYFGDMQLKN